MSNGRKHTYRTQMQWTGNTGSGTSGYRDYSRSHEISADGKPPIAGSSDPVFRGDRSRWNPEELLVAALASCHQLAYLHLCATAGIVVVEYVDESEGLMEETSEGGGRFVRVTLRPQVVVTENSDLQKAAALHDIAHAKCFIASSVNFPVLCEPSVLASSTTVRNVDSEP